MGEGLGQALEGFVVRGLVVENKRGLIRQTLGGPGKNFGDVHYFSPSPEFLPKISPQRTPSL
jgi:hypothetical protein